MLYIYTMNIQCFKCKEDKDISLFSKNSKKKLGVNGICKECHSKYRKLYYKSNKDKELSQVKIYQSLHPEIKSFCKKAGRTVKSRCPKCNSDVFLTKRESDKGFTRYCSYKCRSSKNKSDYYNYLYDIQKRAKKLKKDFDLDEHFITDLLENKQKGKCCITNLPIYIRDPKKEATLYNTASLDRIDSKKGYTKENVQWVALGINYMKLDFSESELHKMLELIKENYTSVA